MTGRKVRFNAIDAIIILIFAAAIGLLLYIFVFSNDEPQTAEGVERTIQYVVEIQNINDDFDSAAAIRQPVQDGVTRKNIGTVVGVLPIPFEKMTFNYEKEQLEVSTVEGKITLKVTIEAQVLETDRAYSVNGYEIRVGEQFSLMMPGFYGIGYCTDIIEK